MTPVEIAARAQMERAIGELRAMVVMNYDSTHPETYNKMKKRIEDFIEELQNDFG